MREPRTRTVALIFGGRNSEHEVSCRSAAAIMTHLDRSRYHVIPVRIDTAGFWTVGTDTRPATQAGDSPVDAAGLLAMTSALTTSRHRVATIVDALAVLRIVDVVVPALHGPFGEDGTLQSLLDGVGVPYVGSGVLASAAGMDKEHTKTLLAAEGLRVADGVVVRHGTSDLTEAQRARLGLPVFVKPARGGSSVGVSRVDSWADVPAAVTAARVGAGEEKVLVETAIGGREVDVAVLEHPNGRVVAGPPLEIRVTGAQSFFDYAAKYSGAGSVFDIPAKLPEPTIKTLQAEAVRVFRALGCAGLLRVDFFLPDGGAPVVNEVNTLPGLTPASQFPRIWASAGMSYPQLLDTLIATALARAAAPAQRGPHISEQPDLVGIR
jgi:D-alanine-D-alanine ligase